MDDKTLDVMRRVRQLRARRAVDGLNELRLLAQLDGAMTQTQLARMLGVSQPSVSERMRRAAQVAPVRDGFSGASPYEIAQRYAAGLLGREQMMEELVHWPYEPYEPSDALDWTTGRLGEWEQVATALDHGLIDAGTYDAVLDHAQEAHGRRLAEDEAVGS